MKNKELDTRKIFGTIIGIVIFVCCALYFTYAWYEWRSENTNVVLSIQDASKECEAGPDVNVENIGPVLDYNDGVSATFAIANHSNEASTFELSLNITSISDVLLVESFKYILLAGDMNGTSYKETGIAGSFTNFQVGSNVISSAVAIEANATYNYKFIVYIDGTMYNDSNMQEASMNSGLLIGNCDSLGISDYNNGDVNRPNLDRGMIPVYYDTTEEVWKKADSSNTDNSWYDYENKNWANAVLISDSTKRTTYRKAAVDTTIPESDITAFYVWIPRFKYRVWNLNRQAGDESTYAYLAYSEGIDIVFEKESSSTGNVECNYNVNTVESETNLSDVCIYNDTDTITTTSNNLKYTDAWYTHPAFHFGGVEKTGFWIGKFETSGSAAAPKVVPDARALVSQIISTQFTTSKVFQTYGLSDSIDAHMLTNLEWGAVAYLTHSTYGLCDETGCRDVYINNSSEKYTGRSGGAIAGSTSLQLTNFFGSASTTSTLMYNSNGYYTYKGYKINIGGTVSTTEKDVTKVASTTGNVTGVYDLSGGSYELLMGNMVNNTGAFYPNASGTNWNGSTTLDSKYYNSYSYGESNYYGAVAFNRSRLGDATAEITVSNSSSTAGWKDTNGNTNSVFVSEDLSWVKRGGYFNASTAGSFYLSRDNGTSYAHNSFRSSLS